MQPNLYEPSRWLSFFSFALVLSIVIGPHLVAADPNHEIDTANWITLPIASIDGFFPTPWMCGGTTPNPQNMLQFHQNWHCTNPDRTGPNWGNRFFGFHKQFLLGYNRYLASVGEPNVQTWVPFPGAPIPPAHSGRVNGVCTTCISLPDAFRLPAAGGTLDTFTTVTAIGNAIVSWHNTNHGRIAASGGTGSCNGGRADMNCPSFAPRDPIFYRYHHIFDDVQDAWRTFQPTDIAIVLDRSGSMSSLLGGRTRLDIAKDAALIFADLLEDGSDHNLGMVSFSTTASSSPDMPLTSIPAAPAALSAALASLVPSGLTSIGSGLQKAQALVGSGSHSRKAILLLTDGQENTPPYIADVAGLGLGDTHVCSIGLGASRDLDGPKLQDLSERQGGIYMSTPNPLELKKFFVFCFANIFDTFVGKDPFGTLPSNQLVSAPTVHHSLLDEKIVFVLSWTNPSPPRTLMLAITTPSGNVLDLDAPGVESKFGPTWHIVRFKPPFKSERDGNWTARAIRPINTYVNGFSSRSFADFDQGVALVRNEIANLCPLGCRRILYYEDTTAHTSFVGHNSVYSEALFMESGQHALGNITRPANATEFFKILQQEIRNEETSFDLLVYSSQFTQSEQPYDSVLAKILCSNSLRSIISDNRHTQGAREILRCAGALRGKHSNFTTLLPTDSLLLDRPYKLHSSENVVDFSYELLLTNRTAAQATSDTNAVAVLARGRPGKDEEFFITVLTRAAAKVKPFNFRKNTYTLEPFHPAFHIPDMYWPKCGYDKVEATVNITRPLCSLAKQLASVGSTNGTSLNGEPLNIRQAAARRLEEQGVVIPTETRQYQLYDDGTHGDTTANDHYWETNLPSDFTAMDGDYHMHAFFRLCKRNRCGPDSCVDREAQQTITVRAQMDPKCKVTVEKLQPNGNQSRARILIKPVDRKGTPLGPGLVDELILMPIGGVKIESKSDYDGCGTYQILVTWEKKKGEKPGLIITQFGRPKNAIRVKL